MTNRADFSFEQMQAELNYRQVQSLLRQMVAKLDLTPRERSGLEPELAELDLMLEKLEQQVVQIAVFGMVGRGKSSVLNALVGRNVFKTGPLHGVTRSQQGELWQEGQVKLVDTPGIDEVDGAEREAIAEAVARHSDLILFVVSGDLTQVEYEAFLALRQASKPILIVLNKIDQYAKADREEIVAKICGERLAGLISSQDLVLAAASPLVARAVQQPNGEMEVELVPGKPQIEQLKLKILEVLEREGKALVALNTVLFADTVQERVVARKMFIRDRRANQIIWNGVMIQAVAMALNPVTVLDLVSSTVIDVAMIVALSQLYGLPMTNQAAIALLQKIALGMGGIALADLVTTLGLGSLKSLFGLGTPVSGAVGAGGYVGVAIAQAAVAGVASYGIGMVTKTYLAHGATWGEEGTKVMVSRILAGIDRDSILHRIKQELTAKLDLARFTP
ncbi:MAG: GTP-binding protein [Pseudanabaenaceae cyanobacterium bins.68]|nr:GTP-binding protein [Pseudanabaenaceae cyanobacterium bins.68]